MSVDTVLIGIGATLLVVGVLSRLIKRLWLSSVLLALLVGVVLGPEVTGVLDPSASGDARKLMEEVARVTIAIALVGAGLQLTRRDLRENRTRGALLLTGGMVGMWVMSGLGAWLLLDLPFWVGFLLGAIVTPTDPVVASTLVTGPLARSNLPRWLRRTLQLESGANDGLALPFVLLAAYMATGRGAGEWALEAARQLALAVGIGAALGFVAAKILTVSLRDEDIEDSNLLGLGIALGLLVLGLTHALGGSGILASFVSAVVFSTLVEAKVREVLEQVQDAITKYFVLPAFILFGALLPWAGWADLGVAGLLFALWVLLLRRPPVVLAVLRNGDTPLRGRAFLGWFGPVGAAAIFYATFVESFAVPEYETVFAAATLAITASVVVHSITATPGVRAYAGRSPTSTLRHPLRADSETAP